MPGGEDLDWFEQAKQDYIPGVFGYKQIAKKYGLSPKTVESRFLRAKKKNILFEDKRPEPTQEDIFEAYEIFKRLDKKLNELDTKQTKARMEIPDDKPCGIAFWGDWHIGARGVNYTQFDEDKQKILETDGLYFIGMGDYKDNQNALIHANGVTEQIATPGIQDLIVKAIMQETGHKAIALVRGCHDDWDKKLGDKDFVSTLCSEDVADCVNLWHGGSITIKLGDFEYKIRARHKYKYESSLNTTNSQRNLLNNFGPCDVIALAHKHFPDHQELDRMGQKVIYFRSGTYKVYDEHGQKIGGYVGQHGAPMIVIYPNKKKIVPFRELDDGITFLRAVRA
jgi:hypothetical protein